MASFYASASASVSTADDNEFYYYDVFLNHRGPDVKQTFASDLYHRLKAHGLQVFLDKEELQKGEKLSSQIVGAIQTALVHIAIFSPNYAQSNWCLDELLLMRKSMLEKRSTILPVFFGVRPSELRRTEGEKGAYAQALSILEEKKTSDSQTRSNKLRYDSDTIGKWRRALSDVADICGFELDKYNGRDKEQLLANVVERVLEIVPKTPLNVSKYPTGVDEKVKDFEERMSLQQHETGKARVVGIVGFGGIGKTTLAKQFFNSKRSHYRRSCFLFDVRESSLKSLQSILLHDLTRLSEQINSTAEGVEKLRKHLSSSRALIILDDVDNIKQLNTVLPCWNVLDSKSLILITSRRKDVLTSWGIGELSIYKLQGLSRQHSTELFCWHAFHQPHPVARFGKVVDKFVNACNGLPLSLQVIGALLYGEKDLENWKAQLVRLSNVLPMDIRNTLKISYDSLEEDEKHIFLDIACFFIGEDKDTAIRIWNGSGWEGRLGLQKLDDKCLVEFHRKKCTMLDPVLEVDGKECIKMHDHLRDLGRSLAETEPWRRLWRLDVNPSPNSPSPVRGITNFAQCSPSVPYISDGQLRSLQLLRAEGCLDEVFRVGQSPQLRWLHWSNCPYSSLPSNISMKNLRVLCIKGSKLNTLWQHESEAPLQLRELHIATDGLLKIPKSIGQLKHLEKIVLEPDEIFKRMRLETLSSEFRHLQSLKHLELRRCSNLKSLPDFFCRLTNLEHVNLYECSDLQMLPDDFGKLTNLRHLRLSRSQLQTFPDSFGNLTNLQCIDLKFAKFQIIPDSFGKLTNLQHVDLSHCKHLETVPSFFENLTNLRYVDLSHCSSLETIPYSWSKKRNIRVRIHKCKRLRKRPSNSAPTRQYNNNNDNSTLGSWFSQPPHTCPVRYNTKDKSTSRLRCSKIWTGATFTDCFQSWYTAQAAPPTLAILICWYIWLERNRALFEDTPPSIWSVCLRSLASFHWQKPAVKTHLRKEVVFHLPIGHTVAFFDGAALSSGFCCGAGGIFKSNTERITKWSLCCGRGSNTKAELLGLWTTLLLASSWSLDHLKVVGDSKVIIDWINGSCSLRSTHVESWKHKTIRLARSLSDVSFHHLPRSYNSEADVLSKRALTQIVGRLSIQHCDRGLESSTSFFNLFEDQSSAFAAPEPFSVGLISPFAPGHAPY